MTYMMLLVILQAPFSHLGKAVLNLGFTWTLLMLQKEMGFNARFWTLLLERSDKKESLPFCAK